MKRKKAFSLTETVVAMALIMIISVSFYSCASFANLSFQKSKVLQNGLNAIENVVTIFSASDSSIDFENNLEFCYGEIEMIGTENEKCFHLLQNSNGQTIFKDNLGDFQFKLTKTDNKILISAKVFYKGKTLYETQDAFYKVVSVW